MKKSFGILFLLFISCNPTNLVSQDDTEIIIEVEDTAINSIDDFDFAKASENFESFWFSNLKVERPLNNEELRLTKELKNLMQSMFDYSSLEGTTPFFYIGDLTCYEKVRGTLALGYIDEIHPVELVDEDEYLPSIMWGSCGKDNNYVTPVYGWPFFQDGVWWVFVNTDQYKNILDECRIVYETCVVPGTGGINSRVEIIIPDIYLESNN